MAVHHGALLVWETLLSLGAEPPSMSLLHLEMMPGSLTISMAGVWMEGRGGGAGCSSSLMLRTLRQFGLQLGFRVCLPRFGIRRFTFSFHTDFHQAFSRQCYS